MREFLKNVAFGLIVAFCLVGLLEFFARLLLPFPLTTLGTYMVSNDYIFFHRPNSVGYEVSPIKEYPPIRLQYNEHGFRGEWASFPPNKPRAYLVGDSYIEARQVIENRTATEVLNQIAPEFFWVNSGCSAHTTTVSYLLLKNKIAKLEPKKIVFFFTFNDYSDNFGYGGYYTQPGILKGEPPKPEFQPGTYQNPYSTWRDYLLSKSAILANIDLVFAPKSLIPGGKAPTDPKLHIDFVAVNKVDDEFDDLENRILKFTHEGVLAMKKLTEELGAEFSMVILPMPTQVAASEWQIAKGHFYGLPKDYIETSRVYQDRLLKFCAEQSIKCLDLLPHFQQASGTGEKLFFSYDGHWTEQGNRVVAEAVSKFLGPAN